MITLLQHILEHQVEAYIQQGWQPVLLQGHHAHWRRFLASIEVPA